MRWTYCQHGYTGDTASGCSYDPDIGGTFAESQNPIADTAKWGASVWPDTSLVGAGEVGWRAVWARRRYQRERNRRVDAALPPGTGWFWKVSVEHLLRCRTSTQSGRAVSMAEAKALAESHLRDLLARAADEDRAAQADANKAPVFPSSNIDAFQ